MNTQVFFLFQNRACIFYRQNCETSTEVSGINHMFLFHKIDFKAKLNDINFIYFETKLYFLHFLHFHKSP